MYVIQRLHGVLEREMVQEKVRFDGLLYFRERKTVWDTVRMGENSFTGLREFPEVIFLVC